jgi:hypothetical protein
VTRRAFPALSALAGFILAACSLPGRVPGPRPALTPSATATATPIQEQCYFNWATEALPELSAQVEGALRAAGLPLIAARAEAYGENCYGDQSDEILYFAAMETDFRVTLEAADLDDRAALGDLLETTLAVLDGFPPGATPGPQPGYIGVTLQAGDEVLNLWFTVTDGESARALGLRGEALLDELIER